jgi:hypothetical protein
MDKKTIAEQWDYFDATLNPDVCVWPEDAGHETTGESTQALRLPDFERAGRHSHARRALYGLFACHIWRRFALSRNEWDVARACDPYLFPDDGSKHPRVTLDQNIV